MLAASVKRCLDELVFLSGSGIRPRSWRDLVTSAPPEWPLVLLTLSVQVSLKGRAIRPQMRCFYPPTNIFYVLSIPCIFNTSSALPQNCSSITPHTFTLTSTHLGNFKVVPMCGSSFVVFSSAAQMVCEFYDKCKLNHRPVNEWSHYHLLFVSPSCEPPSSSSSLPSRQPTDCFFGRLC